MLKLGCLFTNHCVLQRDKKIRVFGHTDKKIKVVSEIILNDRVISTGEAIASSNGYFEITMPELQAMTGLKLRVKTTEEVVELTDVAVGEVWLAGGQSNMEYELQNATDGRNYLEEGNAPLVRFFYTPKLSYFSDDYEKIYEETSWNLFSKDKAYNWSAVGFWYAKELSDKLGVTIGVIGCNWGGTVAYNWIGRDYLLGNKDTAIYMTEYENSPNYQLSFEDQLKQYKDSEVRMASWEQKSAEIYEKEPMIPFDEVQKRIGICEYPGPMNECNFTRPGGLYKTMLSNITPYTIRGVIYYQGESDDVRAEKYDKLLGLLIKQWRDDFKDDDIDFLIVGLPMHRYLHDEDNKSWCVIRANQRKVADTTHNVYLADCIDCGEFHQIHPVEKKFVSHRLYLQAVNNVYKEVCIEKIDAPKILEITKNDDGVRLLLSQNVKIVVDKEAVDNYISCLNTHPSEAFNLGIIKGDEYNQIVNSAGFELIDDDGNTYLCDSVIVEDNSMRLSSKKLKNPAGVRYIWKNYYPVFVFGTNDLPLGSFEIYPFT